MLKKIVSNSALLGVLAMVATGCAGAVDEGSAPAADTNELDGQQTVTSVNSDGTWTSNAAVVNLTSADISTGYLKGAATFTGPTGKTRKMGVCALVEYNPPAPVACSTVADCNSAPTALPTGGSRYCAAPNNSGQKYCYYRPGGQTSYCAGSPANGGVAVAPGTYTTPSIGVSSGSSLSIWMSYGCFEGCLATDPSSSSPTPLQTSPVITYPFGGSGGTYPAANFTYVTMGTTTIGGTGAYTYAWAQTGGPTGLTMNNATTAQMTAARGIANTGTYTYRVTVTDSAHTSVQSTYSFTLY